MGLPYGTPLIFASISHIERGDAPHEILVDILLLLKCRLWIRDNGSQFVTRYSHRWTSGTGHLDGKCPLPGLPSLQEKLMGFGRVYFPNSIIVINPKRYRRYIPQTYRSTRQMGLPVLQPNGAMVLVKVKPEKSNLFRQ